MMKNIEIITGWRSGAERAALDVALEIGIPCTGWVPECPQIEMGPVPPEYGLKVLVGQGIDGCIEKHVIDSDGTLILAHGRPTKECDLARHLSLRHGKQLLHIDPNQRGLHEAIQLIRSWVEIYRIKSLHITGPSAIEDPGIYPAAVNVLASLLGPTTGRQLLEPEIPAPLAESELPESVESAVKRLLLEMPLRDRSVLAHLSQKELPSLHPSLNIYIRHRFGLETGNTNLMESCRFVSRSSGLDPEGAAGVIIEALWKRLRGTHIIRCIK